MSETIRKNVDLDILDYYDTKIKDYVDDKVGTGGLTIDTALSDTSTHPVQNKVIKAAIDDKADKTTATTEADGLMSAADKTKLDGADNTYALKSKYGDTTINVGRKAGSDVGNYSTAEGFNTISSGHSSHSEGNRTTAKGHYSHAEGLQTQAIGGNSHAEGAQVQAIGDFSHAEGCVTIANGVCSSSHGYYTQALHDNEAAYGKYNESNDNTLFSIGDGTADDARHNAFEITTDGGKLHGKDIATTDLIPIEFARSYNDELKVYLNGQSGDIRALVYQLPIGEYALYTMESEYSGITFPIQGYCLISWFPSKSAVNDFMYGTLIIRPMSSVGATYICSVYNTYSYTDWQEISTTPIKSTTVNGSTDSYGSLLLWSGSGSTPIAAVGDANRIFTPFIGSGGNYYLAVRDLEGNAIANTTASATVFYI